MSDFKKLKVWQKAHALTTHTIMVAKKIRGAEYTSLKSQMVRAAVSVTANIVEGRSQETAREFARFLRISFNSAAELEYHILLSCDIALISKSDFDSLQDKVTEVQKMLHGLITYLKKPPRASPPETPEAPDQGAPSGKKPKKRKS